MNRELTAQAGTAAGLTALLVSAIWHFGHIHFSGYDLSSVINTAWLLNEGLKPYRDFFLPFPPAFSLGAKAAFAWFGAGWPALVAMACLFSAFTFNIHFYLLARLINWKQAAVMAFVCQAMAAVLVSFWWYNSMTAIAACLFITAALVFMSDPGKWSGCLWLAFTAALLALLKPNAAGFLICAVMPVLLFKKERRRRALLALLIGAAAALALLVLNGFSPLDVLDAYAFLSGSRGKPTLDVFYGGKVAEFFVAAPLLAVCAVLLLGGLKRTAGGWRRDRASGAAARTLVLLAGAAAALIAVFSSWELIYVDAAPLFLAAFLPGLMAAPEDEAYAAGPVFAAAFILALAAGLYITSYLLKNYYYADSAAALSAIRMNGTVYAAALAWLGFIITMAVTALLPARRGRARLPAASFFMAAAFCLTALMAYAGGQRWRVKISGPPYEDAPTVAITGNDFFKGCRVSPWTSALVGDIGRLLAGRGVAPAAGGVFFGPRLEFAYAAFGLRAPVGFPLWWSAGTSYKAASIPSMLAEFKSGRIQLAVFMRMRGLDQVDNGGRGLEVPPELMQALHSGYKLSYYGELAVFSRKV